MLDVGNALENYSYVGYMQPLTEVTPAKLIAEKLLPPQLVSTVVLPSITSGTASSNSSCRRTPTRSGSSHGTTSPRGSERERDG